MYKEQKVFASLPVIRRIKPFLLLCFVVTTVQASFAQKAITTASLLKDLTDYSSVTKWPDPYYQEMQASSYDRKSVSPDKPGWFANADASQFIRTEQTNGHKEYVMMDADGPGAIIRFWLTTFKREGVLRVYFDSQTEPDITIPAYDLMKMALSVGKGLLLAHSSYEPKEKGGSNLYLPMPFAKHCKVTWEDADSVIKQPRYYQINYRKYAAGTQVNTFASADFGLIKQLADNASETLFHPVNDEKGIKSNSENNISAGKSIQLKLPAGSSAITSLRIKLTANDTSGYADALHSAILKITFDGDETVSCPLDLFSGSGVGGKEMQSWYRTVTGEKEMISRWVMPYQKAASISIQNNGKQNIKVSLSATTSSYKWDNNTMYFHADWKEENNIAITKSDTAAVGEWSLNKIEGKGVFAGETFSVNNHMHYWYGEGDQKLWIDGEKFPSEFGTGTEDYFNTSWAPVVLYQTPFANATRADFVDSYGDNTFTRTRNLDVVPFTKSFNYTLEMLGWQNGTIDASVVTYWYGFSGAKGRQ